MWLVRKISGMFLFQKWMMSLPLKLRFSVWILVTPHFKTCFPEIFAWSFNHHLANTFTSRDVNRMLKYRWKANRRRNKESETADLFKNRNEDSQKCIFSMFSHFYSGCCTGVTFVALTMSIHTHSLFGFSKLREWY